MTRILAICAVSFLVLMGTTAHAAKVIWQSSPGKEHVTSTNADLDESVTFEIGYFDSGFTPTSGNTTEWASHWTVIDRTTYNPDTKFFASSVEFTSNVAPYLEGQQVYMWGSFSSTTNEWILATDAAWLWPSASLGFPVTWNIRFASTVVVGNINDSGTPHLLQTAEVQAGATGGSLTAKQWLTQYFSASEIGDPEIGQLTSDPDGDGRDNFMEMALGTNPEEPNAETEVPYVVDIVTIGGFEYLRLTVPRQAIQQLDYQIEVSGDLKTWQSGEPHTTTLTDSVSTLVVRDNVALEAGERRFIRLTVLSGS